MKATKEEDVNLKLFEKFGGRIRMMNYSCIRNPADFECLTCEHKWSTNVCSVLNGTMTGCQKCSNKITTKEQSFCSNDISKYLSDFGCLLNGEYKNNYTPMKIIFYCGHSQWFTLGNFNKIIKTENGKRLCGKCRKNIHKKERSFISDKETVLFARSLGFLNIIVLKNNGKNQIEYDCRNGHHNKKLVSTFYSYPVCKTCSNKSRDRRGSLNSNWKGGTSDVELALRECIFFWKQKSMFNSHYRCVITGDINFDVIHHLHGFNLIVNKAHENLNIFQKRKISDYEEKDFISLTEEVIRLHDDYPLGICLRNDIHELFHFFYTKGDNTPEQFYEFVERIKSGEIKIPE